MFSIHKDLEIMIVKIFKWSQSKTMFSRTLKFSSQAKENYVTIDGNNC